MTSLPLEHHRRDDNDDGNEEEKLARNNNNIELTKGKPKRTEPTIQPPTSTTSTAILSVAKVPPPPSSSPSSGTTTTTIHLIYDNIRWWIVHYGWPGLGLFGESYVLFGIGTLSPILELLFPQCYNDNNDGEFNRNDDDNNNNNNNHNNSSTCPTWIVHSMTYSVVIGVMVGMISIGYIANNIGRRNGSILTATLMSIGAICMFIVCTIFQNRDNDNDGRTLFLSLSILLFIFGIGVGGEYPLSASSASEKATIELQQKQQQQSSSLGGSNEHHNGTVAGNDKSTPLIASTTQPPQPPPPSEPSMIHDNNCYSQFPNQQPQQPQPEQEQEQLQSQQQNSGRGRQIQLVFAMQGMGIWVNCLTLMILLWLTGRGQQQIDNDDNDDYNDNNNNNNNNHDRSKLFWVCQMTYLIGAMILLVVLITRYLFLQESQVWQHDKNRREDHVTEAVNHNNNNNSNNEIGLEQQNYSRRAEENELSVTIPPTSTKNNNNNNNNNIHKTKIDEDQSYHRFDDDHFCGNNSDNGVDYGSTGGVAATTRARNTSNTFSYVHGHDNNNNNKKELPPSTTPSGRLLTIHSSSFGGDNPNNNDDGKRVDVETTNNNKNASSSSLFGPPHIHINPQEQLSTPIVIQSSTISELSSPTLILRQEDYERQMMEENGSFDAEEDLQSSKLRLLVRNYGIRLLGASLSWLLWDISFYGNKLFQATFLLALTGEETTLLEFAAAATLNATVALVGYFGAAALIDRPDVGRVKLQTYGFLVTGALFVICGFSFDQLSSTALVLLYLASSFFGQLGPNATTFAIPAEIFPTEQRTLCHGICAASGKVGALIAAIMFHHVENDADLFLLSGYASFAACLISLWTIPETNGLDLLELDIKWRMTLEGRKGDYTGPANHPDHLSMYERWKKGSSISRHHDHQLPPDWDEYID